MAGAIQSISSPTNPRVKALRALDRKKARAETGLFLAEGMRLVQQGLSSGWSLDMLAVADTVRERPAVQELLAKAAADGADVLSVPDRVMSKIVRKDNPQGLVGAFRQKSRGLDALGVSASGLWLGLYEVRDPGNLGTILRTADCAGIGGIVLIETCCDPYSVEAVRASMGSIFDVPFAEAGFDAFNAWRTAQGARLIAASMNGTVRHDQAEYGARAVILMGNEQSGLPADVEAACDTLARIPMRGGADSLNLAQATAILTYEAWRQKGFA